MMIAAFKQLPNFNSIATSQGSRMKRGQPAESLSAAGIGPALHLPQVPRGPLEMRLSPAMRRARQGTWADIVRLTAHEQWLRRPDRTLQWRRPLRRVARLNE